WISLLVRCNALALNCPPPFCRLIQTTCGCGIGSFDLVRSSHRSCEHCPHSATTVWIIVRLENSGNPITAESDEFNLERLRDRCACRRRHVVLNDRTHLSISGERHHRDVAESRIRFAREIKRNAATSSGFGAGILAGPCAHEQSG